MFMLIHIYSRFICARYSIFVPSVSRSPRTASIDVCVLFVLFLLLLLICPYIVSARITGIVCIFVMGYVCFCAVICAGMPID